MKHIGIYLSNAANRDFIIEEILSNDFLKDVIDLAPLKGELYSTITINRFIEEELRHDRFLVQTAENESLQSMSSGQQRKALLSHLLAKNPQYMVLDDIYSSLDTETCDHIRTKLQELSTSTLFIQLFFRKQDALPFLHTIVTVNSENKITNRQSPEGFHTLHAHGQVHQQMELPHLFTEAGTTINPLVQLNNVCAAYGNKAVLKNINWTINSGEFWQLKGPNGSGKSTLLSMIIGDNPRGYGQDMILFGRKKGTGETIWDLKKQIGYFTPTITFRFTHNDTVENMIISGLVDSIGLYRKPSDAQRNIAKAWLEVLGVGFRNKRFNELSPGQQRILMVVRAMVKHPPLLVLDEPTAGLDDENTQLFIRLIHAIAVPRKVAILYVSHRSEADLRPEFIFELIPGKEGSKGKVQTITNNK